PWQAKGDLMRRVIEESKGLHTELTDGVKVFNDKGWALILPDADEPLFRVYGEGESMEMAEELTAFYCDKLKTFLR
ncbi:MAG: nucleotidyltransferase, partial [Clostridiales bacterium]|nr:nucleotidyltransferase [Clostridiales bacterium]